MKATKTTYTRKQIDKALEFWTKKLNESKEAEKVEIEEADEMMSAAEFFKDSEEEVEEAEDLPTMEQTVGEADDSFEDDELKKDKDSGYSANTVGAFIDVLKRKCKMTDILLPRLTAIKKETIYPGKREMMAFDIYSKSGRAVIDFVFGRADDPSAI